LYDQEHRKARQLLEAVEEERAHHAEETVKTIHTVMKETHEQIRNAEAALKAVAHKAQRNRVSLQSIQEDGRESLKKWTELNVRCKELEESYQAEQEQYKLNQKELKKLEGEIARVETELQSRVQPAYEKASQNLQNLVDQRDQAAREMEALYAKQGRGKQFATRKERDAFLQKNLNELKSAHDEKQAELSHQRDSLANLRRTTEQETIELAELQSNVTQKTNNLQDLTKTTEEKKSERLQLLDARKESWRRSEERHDMVREAREQYNRAVSDTRKTMPRATAFGIEALNHIVEQEGLIHGEQYFGMLINNFTLRHSKYQTAVEVAANNSLFHVIVDNDNTASKLLTRLEKHRLGRVTFLPLNRLRVDSMPEIPDGNTDVRSMLDICIDYDPKVERAMQHVFGKKLLARTPEVASEWSAKLSVDAITLDGDLCSRKGALTGGYVDVNKSRLGAHQRQQETQKAWQEAERDHQQCSAKAQETDQAMTTMMQDLQRLEAKHAELSHLLASEETKMERLQSRLEQRKKQAQNIENASIPVLERGLG